MGKFVKELFSFLWSGRETIVLAFAFFAVFWIVNWCSGVYVCISPSAYTYHTYEDCEALERCSGQTKKIMRFRAWMGGKDLCRYCKVRMEEG